MLKTAFDPTPEDLPDNDAARAQQGAKHPNGSSAAMSAASTAGMQYMIRPLAAFFLSSNLVVAVADEIPQFNVDPSCRAAAAAGITPSRNVETCKRDEQDVRDRLGKEWTQFAQSDRAHCVQLATMGGEPTYTELLTCLEMARDARNLRDQKNNATTGRGG
jgi:hypothetical protein